MLIWFRVLLLIGFCVLSDYSATTLAQYLDYILFALLDSAIHFITGALSWHVIFEKPVVEVIACGILSSAIDVDHFLSAKSLSLKAAISLPHRPIFHAVISIPVVAALAWIFGKLCIWAFARFEPFQNGSSIQLILLDLPFLLVVAWFSHQLRDSTRRGLWFWPLGSLPKTNYFFYLFIVSGFPLTIYLLLSFYHPRLIKSSSGTAESKLFDSDISVV